MSESKHSDICNFIAVCACMALAALGSWAVTSAYYRDQIREKQKETQEQIEEHRLQAIEGDLLMIKRYLGSIQQTMGVQ